MYNTRSKARLSCINVENKCAHTVPQTNIRKSTEFGWNRLYDKYSPSKETQISPIKASQANLKHVIPRLNDKYVDLYIWVVNMSEQYFYDNSFLLLSYSKHDKEKMNKLLHRSFLGVDMNFFNNLQEITLLGEGSYGSVFSCRDPKTNLKFAVKHLSAKFKKYTDHAENLLDYMVERNSVIKSMDSPLVVKFYYSLQIKETGALFLFFECCIGDLIHFISDIKIENTTHISEMLHKNAPNIIQGIHIDRPEVLDVSLLYIFEMFCGLDFLVQCNIVHQDIKPDNLMISESLHLKIGDFGLAYKTRTIHRETNKVLVKVNDINTSESSNYELFIEGTRYYQDFELLLMNLENENEEEFNKVIENKQFFDTQHIRYNDSILEPTFLTDTWAVGLSALMLLFRGFEIFSLDHTKKDILNGVPRDNITIFIIHLIARQKFYKHYIQNGLIKAGGLKHKELMEFFASIFTPRLGRCKGYTKKKKIYHYTKLVNLNYVDMDKLEKIKTFADLKFTRSNIHLHNIPEFVRKIFTSKKKPTFNTFKKFLINLENKEASTTKTKGKPETVLDIDPGMTINFFN